MTGRKSRGKTAGITGIGQTLTLNNLTFTGFTDYDVQNIGTLALSGNVPLNTGITGTGTTQITTGTNTVSSITMSAVC